MELDLDFVRAQFPAFAAEETRDWAFFENAGGSYVPATVSDRLQRFFVDHKVQPYGAFALSKQAGEEMDESYAAIASLINAAEDEITIGPSTTLNFYILAQSLRHLLRVGDEIVVTKTTDSALTGTNLRLMLRNLGITDVIVTGIFTDQCVSSTVRSLADESFGVVVVHDACAAATDALHERELEIINMIYCHVVGMDELPGLLDHRER